MKRIGLFFCATVFLLVSGLAPAQASTTICTAITRIPATITKPGVFCLKKNLSTSILVGNAITIEADNVVLDLNGFMLDGLAAGQETEAFGVYAAERQNITIRNGTVRGFYYGIFLTGVIVGTKAGHLVEDILADQNTGAGIRIGGDGCTIRNNTILTTSHPVYPTSGIRIAGGNGAQVINNMVSGVTANQGDAYGISGLNSDFVVVAGNSINNIVSGFDGYGIYLRGCDDAIIRDNNLSGVEYGISFYLSNGSYMNNVVRGSVTPYTGGTAAGSTNY